MFTLKVFTFSLGSMLFTISSRVSYLCAGEYETIPLIFLSFSSSPFSIIILEFFISIFSGLACFFMFLISSCVIFFLTGLLFIPISPYLMIA